MNSRFILAFPSGSGNNWQYWHTYLVDFHKGVVDYHCGSHLDTQFGITFSYDNDYRCIELLQNRRNGAKPFFVSSGWTHDDDGVKIPIRFDPIKMAYGTGMVERGWDSAYGDSAYAALESALDAYTHIKRGFGFSREHSYSMREGMARLALAAELKKVFDQLSHSQVVFTARDSYFSDRQDASSLRSLYKTFSRHISRSDALDVELETVYPSPHEGLKAADVKRCVRRFVARHPTRATKTLLSLLAGASALKAA